MSKSSKILYIVLLLGALVAPFIGYPIFLMKVLSFALFACAFNLLIGFTGLLSFGHAMFFGGAAYLCAYAAKAWCQIKPPAPVSGPTLLRHMRIDKLRHQKTWHDRKRADP